MLVLLEIIISCCLLILNDNEILVLCLMFVIDFFKCLNKLIWMMLLKFNFFWVVLVGLIVCGIFIFCIGCEYYFLK